LAFSLLKSYKRFINLVYAYLRLSTNEEKQSNSFDVQLDTISKKCLQLDLSIDRVFKETVSGAAKIEKRKKLLELISVVKANDIVLIQKADRLSRDTYLTGWIKTEFDKKKVDLIFVDNDIDLNNPIQVLSSKIVEIFSEYEREITKARIKLTKAHQKSKGLYLGGPIPYGYSIETVDGVKKLIENSYELDVISLILNLNNSGYSSRSIASKLKEKGILNRRNRVFHSQSILNIIKKHSKS